MPGKMNNFRSFLPQSRYDLITHGISDDATARQEPETNYLL
jgi:hypothetical protein